MFNSDPSSQGGAKEVQPHVYPSPSGRPCLTLVGQYTCFVSSAVSYSHVIESGQSFTRTPCRDGKRHHRAQPATLSQCTMPSTCEREPHPSRRKQCSQIFRVWRDTHVTSLCNHRHQQAAVIVEDQVADRCHDFWG